MINCIAVEYYRKNLFHGDIKPENIFFYAYDDSIEVLFMTSDVGSLLDLGEANE
jgi:serine/threonine protein kinase